jgi:hypothetical protein
MRTNFAFSRNDVEDERIELEPESTKDQIAKRAYFIYLNSAARHGDELEHWLLAEQQTQSERQRRRL